MNVTELYASLGLPESALVSRRVFKKQFHQFGDLASADRTLLSDQLDSMLWQYALKPDNCGVKSFVDEQREYLEIAVLEGRLENRKATVRLAEIVHRVVPYPVLLVLTDDRGLALSVAHKRLSAAKKDAIVADPPLHGPWLDGADRDAVEAAFIDSLALAKLPRADMLDLYGAYADRLVAMQCAAVTGRFRLPTDADTGAPSRLERLHEARALQREVAQLRANLKNQPSFARQVELNNTLRMADRRLADLLATL